VMRHN